MPATETALRRVYDAAGPYLASLADRPVLDPASRPAVAGCAARCPDKGEGAAEAATGCSRSARRPAPHSSGPAVLPLRHRRRRRRPRWPPTGLASLLDQNAFARSSSAFGARGRDGRARLAARRCSGCPTGWGGALVQPARRSPTSPSLGCATHWWGERHGVDVATRRARRAAPDAGASPAATCTRAPARRCRCSATAATRSRCAPATRSAGSIWPRWTARLRRAGRRPAVIIANAGEVNAGDFDPIDDLADLAEQYGAWLHVDGAFGLFAALSPRTAGLVAGIERADSIAATATSGSTCPYESGFALIREPARLGAAFGMPGAPYLPAPDVPGGGYGLLGPESSRRARSLPIWATLAAYGRDGYRAMVERHLDLAQHLARPGRRGARPRAPRRRAAVHRVLPRAPAGRTGKRAGRAQPPGGRGAARRRPGLRRHHRLRRRVALRPAIVNWRTTEADIDRPSRWSANSPRAAERQGKGRPRRNPSRQGLRSRTRGFCSPLRCRPPQPARAASRRRAVAHRHPSMTHS